MVIFEKRKYKVNFLVILSLFLGIICKLKYREIEFSGVGGWRKEKLDFRNVDMDRI